MILPFKVQIRFADVDVMGHVNNAIYLNFFENTRMHYFKQMLNKNWNWNEDGIILLRNEVDYLRPVLMADEPEITMNVEKIGNKSFVLSYELKVNQELYCKGQSILVGYNNNIQASILIPEEMRKALEKLSSEQ